MTALTVSCCRFLQECKEAGKKVMAWTVNEPVQMIEATRWGVDVILTDKTKSWLDLRETLRSTYRSQAGAMWGEGTDRVLTLIRSGLRQDPGGAQQPVPVDVAAVLLPGAEAVAEPGAVDPAEGGRAVEEVRRVRGRGRRRTSCRRVREGLIRR